MIKNLFVSFFILLFSIHYLFIQPVFAQNTSDIPLPILGVNCGIPNDPEHQKCCYNNLNLETPTPPGIIQVIWDVVKNWVSNQVDKLTQLKRNVSIEPCVAGAVPSTPGDLGNVNCICQEATNSGLLALSKFCSNLKSSSEQSECMNCIRGASGTVGIWTSIGCISSDLKGFISQTLLSWGIGLAGIIALLCIIYSAFQMQTSQGNPEKIKKAQELLTSCIMGLMLIIFSIFILKLIGVNILKIPGFQ